MLSSPQQLQAIEYILQGGASTLATAKRSAQAAQKKRETAAAKRVASPRKKRASSKKKAPPKKKASSKKKASPKKASRKNKPMKDMTKKELLILIRKQNKQLKEYLPEAPEKPVLSAKEARAAAGVAKMYSAMNSTGPAWKAKIREQSAAGERASAPVQIAKTAIQAAKRKPAAKAQQVAASTGFKSKFFSEQEVAKRGAAKREEEESKGLGVADLFNYDSSDDESYGSVLAERDQERRLKRQGAQYLSWSDKTAKGKPCTGPIGRYNGQKWCPTGEGGKYSTLSGWNYLDAEEDDADL